MIALPQSLVSAIDIVGWALLHFVWQGVVIGLIYVALRPFFAGVLARYRLGMGALLAMAACPLVTIFLLAGAPEQAAGVGSVSLPAMAAAISSIAEQRIPAWHFQQALPWLVAIWLIGVSGIATRAFVHWRRLSRLVLQASVPLDECRASMARLCVRFGIRNPVRLLASPLVGTPMLLGWLKPVILLPASMLSGFTPQQVEMIIAHELGHVRRRDYLFNLIQVVIETVLFYHPAVHWISRDVRDARENCCDDLVLSLTDGSPKVYASALASLEELRLDMHLASPALAATGGVLLTRIRRIVGIQHALYDPLPRTSAWPILLAVVGALFMMLRLNHSTTPVASLLAQAPAQAISMLTGNPHLNEKALPLAHAPVAMPRQLPTLTVAPPVATALTQQVESAIEPMTPVARPAIHVVANLDAPARVANIRASLLAPAVSETSLPATQDANTPVPLHIAQPEYPQRERADGVTGKVELQFRLDSNGGVHDIRVMHTSSVAAFEQAAIAAMKQWRFSAPADTSLYYTQSFAFAQQSRNDGGELCHEVTGSHICRRAGSEDASAQ